ncbi:class I SAM-dependent methyltransferase [Thalassobacillus hwangdonensis]|uniref:Class I SAM-dependent methyltransferase n=1 Tax=Thalassobacillus hwangdonensis TaxID=546108 RepID=A0ABW3L635_9BACI
MGFMKILEYSHQLLAEVIKRGDVVVDGTCGNGHDTLFLSELVGPSGVVYGFDIQEEAIENTKEKLNNASFSNVQLFHDSHAKADTLITEDHALRMKGAIFNLGYLPGSDKSIVTTPDSTLTALQSLLYMLQSGGRIVLVVYHGHEGGTEEKDALLEMVENLDQKHYDVLQYGFINQRNAPPFIIAIEKK